MSEFNSPLSGSLGSRNLPPQNVEAEESILGGILLDPEAMGRVVDLLRPEAFYISAHKEIYQIALLLHTQGQPTDLMTVTSTLQDRGLLDKVGGTGKLAQLLDRTISAINIDRYAVLVMEKYVRRQLIKAGHEIVDLGYDTAIELESVLDQSEQKIFGLSQERPQQGLVRIDQTLIQTFNEIENLSQNTTLPGISSDFYDLDAMTSGFQRSDLIIVAGRPSMGKCLEANSELVLPDGSLVTIEEIYHRQSARVLTLQDNWQFSSTQVSAFVDDGIKPVFRVITRLGRCIETTLTHPLLTIQGWRKLGELKSGDKIAVPRTINVFGEETIPEARVKLLAYLIGDGCLTRTCALFTNSNPLLREEFTQAINDFVGLSLRFESSNGTRTPSLNVRKDPDFVDSNRNIFAQQIKAAIKSHHLSANKLAKLLKISPSLISAWFKGECVPNQETFAQLCLILNLNPQQVVPYGINSIRKNSPNALAVWLQELGLLGKDSHAKTIPDLIFRLKRPLVALFLNRLFATDGWATVLESGQSQLGYCSVSEKLAKQVQHLLLRFGVIARLKYRSVNYKTSKKRAWQIDITDGKSIKTFIDEIGIFGKEDTLIKVNNALSTRRYQTNCDLIPRAIWQQIAVVKQEESWSTLAKRAGIKGYSNIHVGKRDLSRERLFQLAFALDNIPLQNLANSEVYWDEITSIEAVGNKQVYDLTIPETHNFVANDICVHNTSFALNIAANVAQKQQLPVAIFSLEMSKEQLAQRLLASEAEIPSSRLRSGRLTQSDYEPLSYALGNLSELPIFIDDTANLTVAQMRSQTRKLQAEQGGKLGLVLLDYLQLMEGSGDNRVQELSKITRSLKGLAREVNAPVMALSQLSRGVEQRTNKRPMMSDLRESGCLSGDSLITLADSGAQVPICELIGKSDFPVWAVNEATMKIEKAVVSNAFSTGIKNVFELKTCLGRSIKATLNHKFLTIHGWKRLDELQLGEHIALPRCLPSSSLQSMSNAQLALFQNGTSKYKSNLSCERVVTLTNVVKSDYLDSLVQSDIYWDKVKSIESTGKSEVYDLSVPIHHNFIANNIVVHNSIEQDADLIIMLYRDSYYNPDSPERDASEVIIVKHRNGPVGTIKLLFNAEITKFLNMQSNRDY